MGAVFADPVDLRRSATELDHRGEELVSLLARARALDTGVALSSAERGRRSALP